MPRWMIGVLVAFLAVFLLTALISGETVFLVPMALLALLVVGYSLFNRQMTKKIIDKHGGDHDAAVADSSDAIPSAHLVPDADEDRPLGDTGEAHDTISPHDLPVGHPGRPEAEAQAGGEDGHTRGNVEGAQGGGAPADSTAESR